MWESFPIQTSILRGDDCQTIVPSFRYSILPGIQTILWKDVPSSTQQWCLSVWEVVRCPAAPDDCLVWMPTKGVLLGKKGIWIGDTRSRPCVYVGGLYVEPEHRGKGLAADLVSAIGSFSVSQWNIEVFLFEVAAVPRTLVEKGALPLTTWSYVWIPTVSSSSVWKECSLDCLRYLPGFHTDRIGWVAYTDQTNTAVFDAHNDCVWYSSILSLPFFNGFDTTGFYCRIHGGTGCSVFAENMYVKGGGSYVI